jgi:hypothetical protein
MAVTQPMEAVGVIRDSEVHAFVHDPIGYACGVLQNPGL